MSDSEDGGDEELIGSDEEEKKNWKGIVIAILVILSILGLIVLAVILITPVDTDKEPGVDISFDDFVTKRFHPVKFDGKWLQGGSSLVYLSRQDEILEYRPDQNKTFLVMSNTTFRQYNTDIYKTSADAQFVLIGYDSVKNYRYSFSAKYKVFNRNAARVESKLIDFPYSHGLEEQTDVRLPVIGWSTQGHTLVYVLGNNLYYQRDPFTAPHQLTSSGSQTVFNGVADWLYEEEILETNEAFWWNPSSTHIAYLQINNSLVPVHQFPIYGDPSNFYGDVEEVAYPKAGDLRPDILPKVKVKVVNVQAQQGEKDHLELEPPKGLSDGQYYMKGVTWATESTLLVTWLNRIQNSALIQYCNTTTGSCITNFEETISDGWITMTKPMVIEDGQAYLITLPEQDGNQGYFQHIAYITMQLTGEGMRRFITQGLWEVSQVVGYDSMNSSVYFLGTNGDPRTRHLYRVLIPEVNQKLYSPECLSCNLSNLCQYVSADFTQSGHMYILHCQGPGVPTYWLYNTAEDQGVLLEGNDESKLHLDKSALPIIEYHQVKTDDGQVIWLKLFVPASIKKTHITMYPLVIESGRSPGTQHVTYKFDLGWESYLTSTARVIYAKVDGRGSSGRGNRWLHSVYKKLGTVDVQDVITAARYLTQNLRFVDKDRVAVWGWGYGGFLALHSLSDPDSDVIRQAIAVAPVIDWRYQDITLSEKFLSTFQQNAIGYENANLSGKAEYLKDKPFILIQGSADRNVHLQHTMQFVKALTHEDIIFQLQVYADADHELSDVKTLKQFYQTMNQFLIDYCWDGGLPREFTNGHYLIITPEIMALRKSVS